MLLPVGKTQLMEHDPLGGSAPWRQYNNLFIFSIITVLYRLFFLKMTQCVVG